ncbi:MAG: peptidase MA family metallohydrolase [Anaerolineales bacterium]
MGSAKNYLAILSLIFSVFILSKPTAAQTTFPLSNFQVNSIFGESITFSANIDPETPFESIDLIFRPISNGASTVIPAALESVNLVVANYQINPQDYIPVFSTIEYWYNIKFQDGSQKQSPKERFIYQDNRFEWEHVQFDDNYQIYWTEGNLAFGQAVYDSIQQSIDSYSKYLDLPTPDTLYVYIYRNDSQLQMALNITNARWIAGHANPAENIIVTSIPTGTGDLLDIKRQIPHELTHIRLYYYLEENYANLPAWYNEGLASLAELYYLPEYREILDAAWKNDNLIPMSNLCSTFPSEPNLAGLAYAQAESFVRFLYNQYGKDGLQRLLDAYKQGHTCSNSLQEAFNLDLDELQKEWYQDTFNSSILPQSLNTAVTWIILLLVIVISPTLLIVFSTRRK